MAARNQGRLDEAKEKSNFSQFPWTFCVGDLPFSAPDGWKSHCQLSSIVYKLLVKNDLDTDHLEYKDAKEYDRMEAYCRGKLCFVLHSEKLSQEFKAK